MDLQLLCAERPAGVPGWVWGAPLAPLPACATCQPLAQAGFLYCPHAALLLPYFSAPTPLICHTQMPTRRTARW